MKKAIALALLLLCAGCGTSAPSPSPAVSPSPEASPLPEPSPSPQPSPSPETEVSPSPSPSPSPSLSPEEVSALITEYFANSVFVGDSVLEGFALYVRAQRGKGIPTLTGARFLTTTIGIKVADIMGDTADENRFFTYKGAETPLEDILKDMAADRVFLMLGMNDIARGFTAEETAARYGAMLSLLSEANPDTEFVVLTNTPKTASDYIPDYCPNKQFNSALLNEYADALRTLCEEDGVNMADVNAAVKTPEGHLPDEFSSDNFVHITPACSEVILQTMLDFAKNQIEG